MAAGLERLIALQAAVDPGVQRGDLPVDQVQMGRVEGDVSRLAGLFHLAKQGLSHLQKLATFY